MTKIAVIGGSGLENSEFLRLSEEKNIETPFGKPSSSLLCGTIRDVQTVVLSRHGKDHTIPPGQVNNRANIYALKNEGCTHILATTACGSLREEIRRGDIVIPDQFIDFTKHRITTFYEKFEPGKMKHTPMADPFDKHLRELLITASGNQGFHFHDKGTVITIEGPRFSTRAESNMFRLWGADIINMSVAPEAILANELGLPYAVIAMSTDFDCWKQDEVPVSWEEVIAVFNQNVNRVTGLLLEVIPGIVKLGEQRSNNSAFKGRVSESDLASMPNIGKTLAEKLIVAGIPTPGDLKSVGSENAFIRIKTIDREACINMLYALEGAIQGIRWHNLEKDKKQELTEFFNRLK